MNPGGDFGKRELSPALRNRFTEIWVEPLTNKSFLITPSGRNDVVEMISKFLTIKNVFADEATRAMIAENLFEFLRFYNVSFCEKYSLDKKNLTMRDIVALMEFISRCQQQSLNGTATTSTTSGTGFSVESIYKHALSMVVVEPVGFMQLAPSEKAKMVEELNNFIDNQLATISTTITAAPTLSTMMELEQPADEPHVFSAGPFSYPVNRGNPALEVSKYSTSTEKTRQNLEKVMRALQLDKSVLLEGMPGVGKSSMIEYIAAMTQNKLTRVSLSEQTDIVDLLGSDLPAPAASNTSNTTSSMVPEEK